MPSRKLSVIVLDDSPNPYLLPGGLEDAGKIKTWFMALNFWARYKGDALPDLVVADVCFDKDHTSPLSRPRYAEPNPLPTGLTHLKPLSVLARVGGRVIGIGIYTGNPKYWERLTHSGATQDQCMGYLAAHELGELAAILGEKSLVAEVVETGSLDPLWKWLDDSTGTSITIAVKIALSNYRKRMLTLASPADVELPQVFVMPDDFAAAVCWCEARARNAESPSPIAGEGDHGLTLTYKDGTRDSILISSLFSDVDDLSTRLLSSHCFDTALSPTVAGEEWEEFDRKGQPFIGRFLSRLGTLRTAYDEAVRIVENFPCLPSESQDSPGKLGDYLTRKGDDPLVAGLVIVFQLARIEKAVFDLWEKYYGSYRWDPRGCLWPSDVNDFERSLRNALRLLLNGIRSFSASQADSAEPDESFSRDDVLEEMIDADLPWPWELKYRDADTEWCRWHFQRLADARVLKLTRADRYMLLTQDTHIPTPPVPRALPKRSGSIYKALGLTLKREDSEAGPDEDAAKEQGEDEAKKQDEDAAKKFKFTLRAWLRASIGYGDDAHTPFRMLYHAFIRHGADEPEAQERGEERQRAKVRRRRGEDSQKRTKLKEQFGKDFLDLLEAGRGPGWLLVLCGQYAEEKLLWHDKATWPDWLLRKL